MSLQIEFDWLCDVGLRDVTRTALGLSDEDPGSSSPTGQTAVAAVASTTDPRNWRPPRVDPTGRVPSSLNITECIPFLVRTCSGGSHPDVELALQRFEETAKALSYLALDIDEVVSLARKRRRATRGSRGQADDVTAEALIAFACPHEHALKSSFCLSELSLLYKQREPLVHLFDNPIFRKELLLLLPALVFVCPDQIPLAAVVRALLSTSSHSTFIRGLAVNSPFHFMDIVDELISQCSHTTRATASSPKERGERERVAENAKGSLFDLAYLSPFHQPSILCRLIAARACPGLVLLLISSMNDQIMCINTSLHDCAWMRASILEMSTATSMVEAPCHDALERFRSAYFDCLRHSVSVVREAVAHERAVGSRHLNAMTEQWGRVLLCIRSACLVAGMIGLQLRTDEVHSSMDLIECICDLYLLTSRPRRDRGSCDGGGESERACHLCVCFLFVAQGLSKVADEARLVKVLRRLLCFPMPSTDFLLLASANFHVTYLTAVVELTRSTLEMNVSIHTSSLMSLGKLLTERVCPETVVADSAPRMATTQQSVSCMDALIGTGVLIRHGVDISTWLYRLISGLHPPVTDSVPRIVNSFIRGLFDRAEHQFTGGVASTAATVVVLISSATSSSTAFSEAALLRFFQRYRSEQQLSSRSATSTISPSLSSVAAMMMAYFVLTFNHQHQLFSRKASTSPSTVSVANGSAIPSIPAMLHTISSPASTPAMLHTISSPASTPAVVEVDDSGGIGMQGTDDDNSPEGGGDVTMANDADADGNADGSTTTAGTASSATTPSPSPTLLPHSSSSSSSSSSTSSNFGHSASSISSAYHVVPPYSDALINIIPLSSFLDLAETSPRACAGIHPALLRLAVSVCPQLVVVQTRPSSSSPSPWAISACSKVDILGALQGDSNAVHLALRHLQRVPDTDLLSIYRDPIINKVLPTLLVEDVELRLLDAYDVLWQRLYLNDPLVVAVATVNNLCLSTGHKRLRFSYDALCHDPLLLFRVHPRSFRRPVLLGMLLKVLTLFMSTSRRSINTHARNNDESTTLILIQDSAIVQLLLELISPDMHPGVADTSTGGGADGARRTNEAAYLDGCRILVFQFLHQMFIANPLIVKLVHFQGYSPSLLPYTVSGIPSMHICLDFLPELLHGDDDGGEQMNDAFSCDEVVLYDRKVFAIRLSAYLSQRYPIPKSASVAHNVIAYLQTRDGAGVRLKRCMDVMSMFAHAFPLMAFDIVKLLLRVEDEGAKACYNDIVKVLPST
eukprot:TRINITY_DN1226_c0_g3_i1.p1 TRINITY_DN1226_c0_g3~~TRINITY_DN1226_c0_g3_i1.p1  ORF type:complete len:1256 (+),score=233.36 TRINITY_DN1226_c0_g3_i1:202-3969(+)